MRKNAEIASSATVCHLSADLILFMPNWLQPIRVYLGWVFLLMVLTAKSVSAENPKISYATVPDWVQETKWTDPTNDVAPAESVETRYLLHEIQERPKKSEKF